MKVFKIHNFHCHYRLPPRLGLRQHLNQSQDCNRHRKSR